MFILSFNIYIVSSLLFNIYINGLPLASNSTIHLFADDTNLTLFHSNVSTLQQKY